jgi:glycosyltransferase involved in cell wall biosynthesis
MHLVIVSPFPPSITGIGQYGYHLTRALANSGVFSRLTVLAGSVDVQRGDHPNHLGLTELDYCWQPGSLNARQAILSRLKHLKPDLIWFNLGASIFGKSPLSNVSGLLTPMSASRLFPTVVTLHELVELADLRALNAPGGALAPFGARLLTRITTRADVICLTMQHYADWLSRRGVDCAHIPIGAYHEPELLAEPESHELLFFTTLAPYKGLELLIKAFARLRSEVPQLHLTIAGTAHTRFPNYVNEFQNLTLENNLQVQFFESNNLESLCNSLRLLINSPALRRAQSQHNFNSIQHLRPKATCHRYIQAFNRALEKRQSTKRIPLLESA